MHTYTHNTLTKTDEVYRVRLMCEGSSGADYINASFVNVSGHTQKLCKCLLLTLSAHDAAILPSWHYAPYEQ